MGYNLIIFVYEKEDNAKTKEGMLNFLACSFVDASRTADYQTTRGLNEIIQHNGNSDDIFAFLNDHKIPSDEVTLMNLADEILKTPPTIGYLTISNALQWRLQYGRIMNMNETISGITSVIRYHAD